MVLVTAVDMDSWNASMIFEAEWAERGAGSQGWAKPYFPSWEAERMANEMPYRFRWNTGLIGPEGEPGAWEHFIEGDEAWAPVPFIDDHGVGKWNMDPDAEWRILAEPQHEPFDSDSWERVADYKAMEAAVQRAIEAHCNLTIRDMGYDEVHLP